MSTPLVGHAAGVPARTAHLGECAGVAAEGPRGPGGRRCQRERWPQHRL